MKSVIASMVAVAGMSVAANAVVNTSVVWQVSTVGGTNNADWSSNVNINQGSTALVYVRARVSYTGTAAPLGLASMVFQPTVSNWDASNALSAFVSGGPTSAAFPTGIPGGGGNTTSPVGVITNLADNTQFGRNNPWGRSALSSTSFLKGFVHTGGSNGAPAGTWLRIAQAQVTGWVGAAGNTTGGSGVPIAQLSNVGRAATDPAFNSNITGITIFRMGLTVNAGAAAYASGGVLNVDAPTDGFGNRNTDTTSPDFGNREVYWWADLGEATGSIRGTAAVTDATITIVPIPTPASLALLGLGGLAAARRRR